MRVYLKNVAKLLGRSPTYRDLKKIPGPSPTTFIRRMGNWSKALKKCNIRPSTFQLMKGEKSYIRENWTKLTDEEIGKKLGVRLSVIRYYRMNHNLWKNRKGTNKWTYRRKAIRMYGDSCEICNLKVCEWHHIIPKSIDPIDWCILCPICHAVITRKLVVVKNRDELQTKLVPFMRMLYKDLKINLGNDSVYT